MADRFGVSNSSVVPPVRDTGNLQAFCQVQFARTSLVVVSVRLLVGRDYCRRPQGPAMVDIGLLHFDRCTGGGEENGPISPGNSCGQRCVTSRLASFVTRCGVPPEGGTQEAR